MNMVVYTLEQCFAKWFCERLTEDADFGKKKIIFSNEAHFDLGRQAKLSKTRPHTLKSRRTQNESLFGADFVPEA